MKRDINAITVLLATQGMINIGAVPDPITHEKLNQPQKAQVFLDLLEVLKEKTRGNLAESETDFLEAAIMNLRLVLQRDRHNGEAE
ncbi:MAG: DUF1844 domain-containing protein [Acidobacteriota bacterium]|jgi:hypothetical protein|nr:DUF1844 domain-containing protein [Acidobacteriota bacterium]